MASIMPYYNDSAILPESSGSTPESASIPHPFSSQRQVRPGTDASEREIRRATAAYSGMVETIDSHYREVLDALTHVGENLDEWIIIYTSDHGEIAGRTWHLGKTKVFRSECPCSADHPMPRTFQVTSH